MQQYLTAAWLLTLQAYAFLQTQVYPLLYEIWMLWWSPLPTVIRPSAQFFLGEEDSDMERYLTVPEDSIYVEEWHKGDTKRYVIRYSGETIPRSWSESPFDKIVRSPWVWVGDRETEIDLTRTFDKFLVAGNRITRELVHHYVRVTPKTRLMYIQSGTFKELDFPGDGITIEEYGPVQNRRPLYRAEEAVPTPVVGGRNDSVE